MKKTWRQGSGWAAGLVLGLGLAGLAQAGGVPLLMNYQGTLADAAGKALANQNLTANFRIYDAAKGGVMLWGTRQLVTTDTNGIFNVTLGGGGANVPGASNQVQSLQGVFAGDGSDSRWFEVEVEYSRTAAMAPRQRFLASPYAYQAGNATGSQGDFNVGDVLMVKSNATFQRTLLITNSTRESLVFHGSLASSSSLSVSQKMDVAASQMDVNGNLGVAGNAVFTNPVALMNGVTFNGPAAFHNGVSLRGNTQVFGPWRLLSTWGTGSGSHSDHGTITTNSLLVLQYHTEAAHDGDMTITFTVDGKTNFYFKADWNTGYTDDLRYRDQTMFTVPANSSWAISTGDGNIGYSVYVRSLP